MTVPKKIRTHKQQLQPLSHSWRRDVSYSWKGPTTTTLANWTQERGSRAGEAKTREKSSQTDDAREKSSIGPMDLAMRIYSITTRSNPKDKVGE